MDTGLQKREDQFQVYSFNKVLSSAPMGTVLGTDTRALKKVRKVIAPTQTMVQGRRQTLSKATTQLNKCCNRSAMCWTLSLKGSLSSPRPLLSPRDASPRHCRFSWELKDRQGTGRPGSAGLAVRKFTLKIKRKSFQFDRIHFLSLFHH